MGFGAIIWLLVLGGGSALVFWLVRTCARPVEHQPVSADASEILRQRYARGELGRDEFERMKQDLRN